MSKTVAAVKSFALTLGAPGLFLVALLDSSFLSLPQVPDLLLIFMVTKHPSLWLVYALVTTAGSVAGCTAIDVDLITTKRAEPERFSVTSAGEKVRDDDGNRMEGLQVRFDVAFGDDEAGRAAADRLADAIRRSHDRLCTVSRTVELGTPVDTR